MFHCRLLIWLVVLVALSVRAQEAPTNDVPIEQKEWYEIRTAHFHIYGCGNWQDIYKIAGQLEQFQRAYGMLAGQNATASPPIVVLAFPDHESMKPFLPLYNGQPANIAGFFTRGSDENLIVLAAPEADSRGMEVIFHEYAHLLFRHNDPIWPVWLKEGMAEIYSTFQTTGNIVRIARPIDRHLETLKNEPLMPLHELFSVGHDSPQYNEASRQGIFYAESWLLTDYLMTGDNVILQSRFPLYTEYLREGQMPEQAFTNALGVSLAAMDNELQRYVKAGVYDPILIRLPANLSTPVKVTTQRVTPVEVLYRLGDEQFRIGRLDEAQAWFERARQLAPASPLPYEGLGFLAMDHGNSAETIKYLEEAMTHGSASFLAHYAYAQEKYHLTAHGGDEYTHLPDDQAELIRGQLDTSIALQPDYAPARELLGFFDMVQGNDLTLAEQQLNFALQLEPENPSYIFTMAQAQLHARDPVAARKTLQPLLLPNADPKIHSAALDMLRDMEKGGQ
jgi:tetratricopeptide (TPR) repeat protein